MDDLVQVVYGAKERRAAINKAVTQMGHGRSGGGHHGVVAVNEVAEYALPELCRIKHPSFKQEKEWRLVYVVWNDTAPGITKFRPSTIGVVPYVEVPLPPDAIREIVLGPGDRPSTLKDSVYAMLVALHRYGIEIRMSESPYRST
jgi:hypothetical protein